MAWDKLAIPIVFLPNGNVDLNATMLAAREAIEQFAQSIQQELKVLQQVSDQVWEGHQLLKGITAHNLARAVLSVQGKLIVSDREVSETEDKLKAMLSPQTDKYFYVPRGKKAGFHRIDRYTQEEYQKLLSTVNDEG